MVTQEKARQTFDFVAGWPALDFTNAFGASGESGAAYPALVRWSEQAGILAPADARRLRREGVRHPGASRDVAARARRLAATVQRICAAIIDGKRPAKAELARLNRELGVALGNMALVPRDEGFALDWPTPDARLDRVLWPVARSAADLLVAPQLDRLKVCDSPTCGYLFVDTSKPPLVRHEGVRQPPQGAPAPAQREAETPSTVSAASP